VIGVRVRVACSPPGHQGDHRRERQGHAGFAIPDHRGPSLFCSGSTCAIWRSRRLGEEGGPACSSAGGHRHQSGQRKRSRRNGDVLAGRQGQTNNLELGNAGLEADTAVGASSKRRYEPRSTTSTPSGDVIGFPALASPRWIRAGWRPVTRSARPVHGLTALPADRHIPIPRSLRRAPLK